VSSLYLDSSAVLRMTLELGTDPELESRMAGADTWITSRLSLLETSRALIRARDLQRISELEHTDLERSMEEVWSRCHVWELTRSVCERARSVAPRTGLRALDAIHLATFLEARRLLGNDVELLTADERLRRAIGAA
jgi:predicted nucleic acid-binding protein